MILIEFFLDFYGISRRLEEINIGQLGLIFVSIKGNEVWVVGLCLIYLKLFSLSCGGSLGLKNPLWTNFIQNKLYKNVGPQMVELKERSLTWKNMFEVRDRFDQKIWWELKYGHLSVQYDNWTQLGAIHYYIPIKIIPFGVI